MTRIVLLRKRSKNDQNRLLRKSDESAKRRSFGVSLLDHFWTTFDQLKT